MSYLSPHSDVREFFVLTYGSVHCGEKRHGRWKGSDPGGGSFPCSLHTSWGIEEREFSVTSQRYHTSSSPLGAHSSSKVPRPKPEPSLWGQVFKHASLRETYFIQNVAWRPCVLWGGPQRQDLPYLSDDGM